MAKPYSTAARTTFNAVCAPEPLLTLVEITHAGLGAPVRVVNDTQDLVHQGNTYIGMAFRFVLPGDHDKQAPRATLEIDNVGRELMQWIDGSAGGQGATLRMRHVFRSRPDQVEYEVTLDLVNVRATPLVVSAELEFPGFLDRPAVLVQYDPVTAPGLF